MPTATLTDSGKLPSDSVLIVIDMQNDFVTGALGSKEAQALVPTLVKKLQSTDKEIWFTQDTHSEDYLQTAEGKNLPIRHCIEGTEGYQIIAELLDFADASKIFKKPTFGSVKMAQFIASRPEIKKIELVGVCTDICVISNALLIKAFRPDIQLSVQADCCAGTTKKSHEAALLSMASCQIEIK
jgi:nicotinamidase-related amidase